MFEEFNPNYSPAAALPGSFASLTSFGNPNYSPASNPNSLNIGTIAPIDINAMSKGGFLSGFGDLGTMDFWFGNSKAGTNGFAGTALGALQGLGSAYLGMKQYGLAKDKFEESKRQFELNYGAQKKLTNSRLEDRQRARVASNPGAYESVGSYMNKNGL